MGRTPEGAFRISRLLTKIHREGGTLGLSHELLLFDRSPSVRLVHLDQAGHRRAGLRDSPARQRHLDFTPGATAIDGPHQLEVLSAAGWWRTVREDAIDESALSFRPRQARPAEPRRHKAHFP